ncbi:MAG: hypothetical protein ABH841_02175 [Candidatus Nealsonbacteria bacterium]
MGKITKTKRILEKRLARDFGKKKSVKIAKQVARFWNLATRLENRRIKGKGFKGPRKSARSSGK